jgi:dolichol-phosphate mannosyltransferase
VIIPCFNEQDGIGSLVARLASLQSNGGRGWEAIVVDDGSVDRTFGLLLRCMQAEPWLKVLRHPVNLGLGAALRTGFAEAASPIVCTMDSDCTYPPEELPELVALLDDRTQIATASAWHPASALAKGPRIRLALSRMVSAIYKTLVGQDVFTFTCLFRAYRREALDRISFRSNGFAAVAEIMLRAMLAGYQVRELPMRLEQRRFGQSKLKIGDAVVAHAGLLALTATLVGVRRVRRLLLGS